MYNLLKLQDFNEAITFFLAHGIMGRKTEKIKFLKVFNSSKPIIPPLSVGLGKRVVDKSLDMDIHSSFDLTAQVQSMLLQTEDFVEGVRAKLEKREPSFKGKGVQIVR